MYNFWILKPRSAIELQQIENNTQIRIVHAKSLNNDLIKDYVTKNMEIVDGDMLRNIAYLI